MTFPQIIGTIGLVVFAAGLVARLSYETVGDVGSHRWSSIETAGNVLMYVGFALCWGWAWS